MKFCGKTHLFILYLLVPIYPIKGPKILDLYILFYAPSIGLSFRVSFYIVLIVIRVRYKVSSLHEIYGILNK